jgi:NarL family two-component system response regulator LiaR
MNKKLLLYGICLALLGVALRLIEYKMVIIDHSLELYGGTIALLFMIAGILLGRRTGKPRHMNNNATPPSLQPATVTPAIDIKEDDPGLEKLGISKREYEILQLMAAGLSNQEIADKTFVSIHTVKTHVSNLLFKLDAKRRTQAVTRARELQLIP